MNNKIINKAKEYIGTPFMHQGRVKGSGVDCLGLLLCVGRELGIYNKEWLDYSKTPDSDVMLDVMRNDVEEKEIKDMQHGDIMLFNVAGACQHLGFYCIENGLEYIIHAYQPVGKVVQHGFDNKWSKRVYKVFSFKERV